MADNVKGVIELGVKGEDVVLGTLKKIDEQKKKTAKAGEIPVGSLNFGADLGEALAGSMSGGIFGKDVKQKSDEERRDDNEEKRDNKKLIKAQEDMTRGMKSVAGSFSKMDPMSLTKDVVSMTGDLIGVASNALFSAFSGIPIVGGAADSIGNFSEAFVQKMTKTLNVANDVAIASHEIYKSSLPEAEARSDQIGLLRSLGMEDFRDATMTYREAADISYRSFQNFGRASKELKENLGKLFKANAENKMVYRPQAEAIASGNFAALGTDKGFILNEIMRGFSNTLPSIRQSAFNSLASGLNDEDFQKVSAGFRKENVFFQDQESQKKLNIVRDEINKGDSTQRKILEASKNLEVKMMETASVTLPALNFSIGLTTTLVDGLNTSIKQITDAFTIGASKVNKMTQRMREKDSSGAMIRPQNRAKQSSPKN